MQRSGLAAALVALVAALAASAQAAPLEVNVGDVRTCSSTKISWDTTGGRAPWTVTILPLNHVPTTVSLPASYSSGAAWSYDWDVPNYGDGNDGEVIVAIADASGAVSGSSKFLPVRGGGSCARATESLDFVWFGPDAGPNECGAWPIRWQTDRANNGIVAPVSVTFVPEEGVPSTYIASAKDTRFDWQVSFPRGTRFTMVLTDQGKSGTGGVGLKYTVGAGSRSSCSPNNAGLTQGALNAATSTIAAARTGGMTTSRAHKTGAGATHHATSTATGTADALDGDAQASKGGSNGGAIAGGIVGALLVIGALVAGVLYWRRRRANAEQGPFGDQYQTPWRYEIDGAPVAGVRRSRPASKLFGALGVGSSSSGGSRREMRSANDDGASLVQASQSSYFATAAYPSTHSNMHRRSPSSGDAAFGTLSSANGGILPPPAQARVVPDDQLFPPPASSSPPATRGARASQFNVLERTLEREREAARLAEEQPTPRSPATDAQTRAAKTSIHDPYTHISQLYERDDVARRMLEMEQRGAAPSAAAATTPPAGTGYASRPPANAQQHLAPGGIVPRRIESEVLIGAPYPHAQQQQQQQGFPTPPPRSQQQGGQGGYFGLPSQNTLHAPGAQSQPWQPQQHGYGAREERERERPISSASSDGGGLAYL
ncbi:hypothetical protein FA09DRAFT_344864 [Tilletiopsis washingtonensis]|uniref:Mid2 domain-containing protein n=1 Tax=Tilletiopsis washingtonensis TaxID=58919 RepID=A0A316ZK61_9BASI|nr:hypothetical protein FA09DRAFT_344864 [Tilletiopsis washingtonensis]PWO00704.1 hypothetical protein FA09DRAFT_344864 [Tilletiopsis washingtonensis]